MKTFLSKEAIAKRASGEIGNGLCINIGTGIPSLVPNFISPDIDVVLHSEAGAIGFPRVLDSTESDKMDYDYMIIGGQFVLPASGMSFTDHNTAFAIATGGRLDITILGALEVSETGDLANWTTDVACKTGGIGGSMDLAAGAKMVIALMTHIDKDGKPKIVKKCRYPLTCKTCVKKIITDAAVIDVIDSGLILKEIAPGWTVQQIQDITEPKLVIARDLREMSL